jgi:regulatory protein
LAPERAWDYALWLLGRQAYTVAEVRERLRRRALPEPEVERVVARLLELALLDDRSFARHYVERRSATRGRLALQAELRRKGVAQEHVDDALGGEGEGEVAQADAAVALLRKQAWRFGAATGRGRAEAAKARARAYALLARRGFAPDAVRAAVDEVLPGDDDG